MTQYLKNIYINNSYSFLGSNKYKPIVEDNVDYFKNDYYFGEKTIELAESKYQELTVRGLLKKENLEEEDIDLLISGDLQNQILSSTLCACNRNIPFLGVYSACASFLEGIIISALYLNKKGKVIVSTSSHNLVSEKQFRFPVEYGAVRKRVNTCTATGSVSALISNKKSNVKIESITIGKVFKTNHKDTNDMGSAMARGCVDTLIRHLNDTKRKSEYYDLILTGDLGIYGLKILKKCYEKLTNQKIENVMDCGSIFYSEDNIYAGASGPVCLPLVLFNYILKEKKYKKILLLATGSLHSVTSSNLKIEIPSICHAVSLEVKY